MGEDFHSVMQPLSGHWVCAGVDDTTGHSFHLTEENAFELGGAWFRSHEVDDRGATNDVLTTNRSGGGKWKSLLVNDDGTYGVFTYDNAPVPASWATAQLSGESKTERFWLKHAFDNAREFHYDIRMWKGGKLLRLEHGICRHR